MKINIDKTQTWIVDLLKFSFHIPDEVSWKEDEKLSKWTICVCVSLKNMLLEIYQTNEVVYDDTRIVE